jgi:hypothetical protein
MWIVNTLIAFNEGLLLTYEIELVVEIFKPDKRFHMSTM